MKVKTSYTGCDYITAGKVYEVTLDGPSETIINDRGREVEIVLPHWGQKDTHLDGVGVWEVVK